MQTAETILNIIRERGQRGFPIEDVYQWLYNPDLYLHTYAKLNSNADTMAPGIIPETVDGMFLEKVNTIIEALRYERYRWTVVQRTYIPKKNSKLRPLSMPSWSDKLLQGVISSILKAYYEPQFSEHSHSFQSKRGCHTALKEITQKSRATKWFIEGDICACFDTIDSSILLNILHDKIHDNHFIRLIKGLLDVGYLENWKYNSAYRGIPQGAVLSSILFNLVLDKLDKYVERELIPIYTRGQRRRVYSLYRDLTMAASIARKTGKLKTARKLSLQAQSIPSRDPNDPNSCRLWYTRYAGYFLIGVVGSKSSTVEIKQKIATFVRDELKLELSDKKMVVTHARDGQFRNGCLLLLDIFAKRLICGKRILKSVFTK